ncbi:DNA primase family protein [Sorangium sp. So ce854]|uniref:DNA primase family protein n=1 Tax=Sorangium sp. So ce854 TaxID=3133322 RepID=UPI003F60BC76
MTVRFARGDHAELAKAVLHALGPAPLTYDAGEFWRYDALRGIWELLPSHVVRHTAAGFAGAPVGDDEKPLKVNVADVRGAEAIARDELLSARDRTCFNGARSGASFRNGFVVVRDGRVDLLPHAPEHRARHGYAVDYEPWLTSRTPRLNAFLEELFSDCSEDESSARVALLQEFVGACLIGEAIKYQKCLVLFGEGGNGKSSVISLIRALFPADAVASVAPQRWSERFALAALEGKLVNLVSETPTSELLDGSAFKAVVTGDQVTAERKHKDAFHFCPIAGHVFSTNWPLTSSDHSVGFWRRPLILPLTRRFDNALDVTLSAESEIIAHELPHVVAWALDGAARLQRQRQYTQPAQGVSLKAEWMNESDQVRLFLLTRPADDYVSADTLYKQYRVWASENGHKNPMSSNKFGRRVRASGMYDNLHAERGTFYRRKVPVQL